MRTDEPDMNRQPALLLISLGILKWTDMDFGLPHLVSVGGYVKRELGIRVELLDLNYEGGDPRQLERTLDELGPFLAIGISCYSSFDYMRVMALARFVRQLYPDTPIVTGGYHASALPEDVLFPGSPFDAVVPGEGERAMAQILESVLGGQPVERKIWPKEVVQDMDALPYYDWSLLDRYWSRAHDIGRKFQIYLSRGCPYRCTFCMERSKSGYKWRAYSAQRALEELERLAKRTELSRWVINLADPLFGFNRAWRREVLTGIVERGLLPRQYWTLTRSDDLHDEDIELLARANFSIGIGMESGSPTMLRIMQKTRAPQKYLDAQLRLARLSRKHGLNWAGNIIVGHPGETPETMRETHAFATELFTSASSTCGWLSIDPFRLYPGSHVHEEMAHYTETYGARFYHTDWWKRWYDGPLRAQHIDPSSSLDFAGRVEFMYTHYAPLVSEILDRFRGQGGDIDRVFKRSLEEQRTLMSEGTKQRILASARSATPRASPTSERELSFPIGLHVRDPWVRKREEGVRRLLERGVVRTDRVIEALLSVAPQAYLGDDGAAQMLSERADRPEREGDPAQWVGLTLYAVALEAINPGPGERVCDALASHGYLGALFGHMVGDHGEVVLRHPHGWRSHRRLVREMHAHGPVSVVHERSPLAAWRGAFDGIWLGATLPKIPGELVGHLVEGGRLVTSVGPRFAPRDVLAITRVGDTWRERTLGRRTDVPVLTGPLGWLDRARDAS